MRRAAFLNQPIVIKEIRITSDGPKTWVTPYGDTVFMDKVRRDAKLGVVIR